MKQIPISNPPNTLSLEDITLDTKVWENDYRVVLSQNYLKTLSARTQISPSQIVVLINNVWRRKPVIELGKKAIDGGLISSFIFVDDISQEVLENFALDRESLGFGYRYSICELAAIYLNPRPYTLHLSGDTLPLGNLSKDFYYKAKALLESSENISVANLMWNTNLDEHSDQAVNEDEDFYYSPGGFSDQMYFVKTREFRAQIYNFRHVESDRYPIHAHGLFEQRVDSYLRVNNKLRATYKHAAYRHENHRAVLRSRLLRKVKPTNK